MGDAIFAIGIDLGTSNCALACAPLREDRPKIADFGILQVQRPGQIATGQLLPSALYAPTSDELAAGGLTLPWESNPPYVAGLFARWRGAKVPGRLITSAKSWLCHPAVDRTAPILPYAAAADAPKISPVQASALLLRHMRSAWNAAHPEAPIEQQEVVVTVPASFDEVARALTVSAAREAGLEHFTLVEEPQAAFYHFSHQHQKRLAQLLGDVRLVLVVDVGGGTTDFTLVQVGLNPDGPVLRRIAVGDHLILGGDNMDNALARTVEEKLAGRKLSATQWVQLVQAAREAKELLLGSNPPDQTRIGLAGEGSQLLGNAISKTITRAEVEAIVLDGFFPNTPPTEQPRKSSRGGIQEMGLPYAADPAITRHLAAFLQKHAANAFQALGDPDRRGLPRPDAILLNGGVFNSARLVQRLVEVISSWWPELPEIPLLEHGHLDLAVARGAAAYGLVRHGIGRRISGGTAHSFHLALAPGKDEQPRAVCLIPRGLEEGESIELKDQVFKLLLGKPVQFRLLTSTADRLDRPGDVVPLSEDLEPLPPIQTLLKTNKPLGEKIPVYLRGRLTELGTVELWCAAVEGRDQWKLEFDVRGKSAAGDLTVVASLHPKITDAQNAVARVFSNKPGSDKTPREARQLWSNLERLLGPRDSWNLPTLRQLASDLLQNASRRRRSADHERIFFQLLGFTMRPGFGFPLDEWRAEQAAKLFAERIEFHKEKPNWNEFWVFWRRVSGGLPPEAQLELWDFLKPWLGARVPPKGPKNFTPPKGAQPEGVDEMVRTAAALEHLPAEEKAGLGNLICERPDLAPQGGPWAWALGRIGARQPFYGSTHTCVSPAVAERWIEAILAVGPDKLNGGPFALAQLARLTGDRLRDIRDATRQKVIAALESSNCSPHWIQMVREVAEMKSADEARVFGDSLPIGLTLTQTRD